MNRTVIGLIAGVIIGIISTVIITSMIQGNSSSKEDFDLEKIRHINEINGCLELQKEYKFFKQYESVLEHSDLYLKAFQDRAKEIVKSPQFCKL